MKAFDLVMMGAYLALGGAGLQEVHGGSAAPSTGSQATVVAQAPAPKSPAVTSKDGGSAAASPATSPSADAAASPAGAKKAPAMDPEVKALVDRVQAFYEQTQDFTARFQQDYTYKAFKRKQTSTGSMTFKKPGLMRWEYEKPSPKTFILSNDKLYAHDPAAMTITRGAFDTSQLSASVTFLWGKGKLADEFSIAKVACKDCKGTLLELTPLKPDARFKKVKLEVDPKTAQVLRSIVIDPTGDENAITFSALKANAGVSDDAFKLTPPPNTQVIDLPGGK